MNFASTGDDHGALPPAGGGAPESARPPVTPPGAGLPPPPPPPGYGGPPYGMPSPPPRSKLIGRVMTGLVSSVLILSLFLNAYAFILFKASASGPSEHTYREGNREHRVVIVPIKGLIDNDTTGFVRQALDHLRKDPPKALVLRVDSGGGTVGGSDRTYHALMEFKKELKIPIVASFGSYAASGGYYVAAPADYIFVEPTTITGSIGVMGGAFTAQGLINMIGIQAEILTASKSKDKDLANTSWRHWKEEDRKVVLRVLDQAYERFVEVVARSRASVLSAEQVGVLASGAVYTAQEAIDNKLVDESGYLDKAVDKAIALAQIDPALKPQVTVISPPSSPLDLLTGGRISTTAPDTARQLRQVLEELQTTRIEYRMAPLQ